MAAMSESRMGVIALMCWQLSMSWKTWNWSQCWTKSESAHPTEETKKVLTALESIFLSRHINSLSSIFTRDTRSVNLVRCLRNYAVVLQCNYNMQLLQPGTSGMAVTCSCPCSMTSASSLDVTETALLGFFRKSRTFSPLLQSRAGKVVEGMTLVSYISKTKTYFPPMKRMWGCWWWLRRAAGKT